MTSVKQDFQTEPQKICNVRQTEFFSRNVGMVFDSEWWSKLLRHFDSTYENCSPGTSSSSSTAAIGAFPSAAVRREQICEKP